jgi:ketosteroid isomerase-like protein
MPLRLCSYNIQDLNKIFHGDSNNLKGDNASTEKIDALQAVLQAIDPDLIGIVEAPNTKADGTESTVVRLETFAAAIGIRASEAMMGFVSPGSQELGVLFDPNTVEVDHSPGGDANDLKNPPFDEEFRFDTDDDRVKEVYEHYRPPLEARVTSNGFEFNLMVVHLKSKGIFDVMDMARWELENQRNRRKLIAECTWVRRRVEEWLDSGRRGVVMGDMNDGPGMDYYEGWATYWTPDARILEPGMDLSGSDLFDFARDFWADGGQVLTFEMESSEVFVHGDAAYQIGQYDESLQFPDGAQLEVANFFFVRWEKQRDGMWRISRLMAGPREAPAEG